MSRWPGSREREEESKDMISPRTSSQWPTFSSWAPPPKVSTSLQSSATTSWGPRIHSEPVGDIYIQAIATGSLRCAIVPPPKITVSDKWKSIPKLESLQSVLSLLTSAAPSRKAHLFWLDCGSSQNYSHLVSGMTMFTQISALPGPTPSDDQPWEMVSWSLGILSLTSPWLLLEMAKQPK